METNRNVFIFHGTEGHPKENWFPWLKEELEQKGMQVHVPQFPSPPVVAAKISEWFDVLDGYREFINEDTIFVGHSLGGLFTLRVLETLNHKIKETFLVAAPIGVEPILYYDRDFAFSGFDFNWEKIRNSSYHFTVFHSDDDPYVDMENGSQLARHLGIDLSFIPNSGHFNEKAGYVTFEKLLADIEKSVL